MVSTEVVFFSVVSCFSGIVSCNFLPYRLWSLRDAINCIVRNGGRDAEGGLVMEESGGR